VLKQANGIIVILVSTLLHPCQLHCFNGTKHHHHAMSHASSSLTLPQIHKMANPQKKLQHMGFSHKKRLFSSQSIATLHSYAPPIHTF